MGQEMVILDELMITMMLGDAADDDDDYDDPVDDDDVDDDDPVDDDGVDDNDNYDDNVDDDNVNDDGAVEVAESRGGGRVHRLLEPQADAPWKYRIKVSCYHIYLVILHILLSFHLLIL